LADVICWKYVEGRNVDLFKEVANATWKGFVAKRKAGKYATLSGWPKIKNPNYTQSEGRHERFDAFNAKVRKLPPVPRKPPVRTISLSLVTVGARPRKRTR
jgi:hypothetical protein